MCNQRSVPWGKVDSHTILLAPLGGGDAKIEDILELTRLFLRLLQPFFHINNESSVVQFIDNRHFVEHFIKAY